jgi:DMSO/TMAO reductase YedYZ heme-binding membrane subunit
MTALTAVQGFMLFYSGVFALVGLTAAVGVGLAAADRIVMVPASRVVAQGVHRAVSLAALAFLVIHIVTETLAHRTGVADSVVPFLAHGRTTYIGLGTIASDLVVLLVVSSIARGRFATRSPWAWRTIHSMVYLCWGLSLAHGLLAGRTAKPYVIWSYGVCVAAVALMLLIRLVAAVRGHRETAAHPVPGHSSTPAAAVMPAVALGFTGQLGAMLQAAAARTPRALPPGTAASPAARPVPQRAAEPAVQEPADTEPPVWETVNPEPSGSDDDPAYAGPAYAGPSYAGPSYAGPSYAGPSYAGPSYADPAYADPSYAAEPYPDGLYPDSEHPGAPNVAGDYGDPAYTAAPYGDDLYMEAGYYPEQQYAGVGYAEAPYPGDPDGEFRYPEQPHTGDPDGQFGYPEDPYPGDPYADLPHPGAPHPQDLWPDHPSWPRNGIVGGPPTLRQTPGAERP